MNPVAVKLGVASLLVTKLGVTPDLAFTSIVYRTGSPGAHPTWTGLRWIFLVHNRQSPNLS
jgi:hypothetical protein